MRRMERLVRGRGLDWTIMRPSGLFVRKAAAVTTSEGIPTLFQIMRREALKKK